MSRIEMKKCNCCLSLNCSGCKEFESITGGYVCCEGYATDTGHNTLDPYKEIKKLCSLTYGG